MESLTQEQQEGLKKEVEKAGLVFFRTQVQAVAVREHPVYEVGVNELTWEYVVEIIVPGRDQPVLMNARRNPDQPGAWLVKPRFDSDVLGNNV